MRQELIWTLDTQDNIVSYICRDCIKQLAEECPEITKHMIINYNQQNFGECCCFLHNKL